MDTLSCVFRNCDWSPTSLLEIVGGDFDKSPWNPDAKMEKYVDYAAVPDEDWNLPLATVHPASAGDVMFAIEYARSAGIGVSVKTTGHNYVGASTGRNTLLLNMRRYPKYGSDFFDQSFVECEGVDVVPAGAALLRTEDLRGGACAVALSRGARAILRVGGGEVWDEIYRAVSDWNEARVGPEGEPLLHVVGGAAGTVSATGGYLGGTGLAGMSQQRHFGFACDQVTQMEMVLPTGQHVRFGPTEWRDPRPEDNSDWPQTTAVTGWCNGNPLAPEEEWAWHVCNERDGIDVSFDDLWHAVRGGGTGYGVTISVEYQLPDAPGRLKFGAATLPDDWADMAAAACGECKEANAMMQDLWANFFIDAHFNPAAVGMSPDDSSLCGGNMNLPYIFEKGAPFSVCYGGGWEAFISAWQRTLADGATSQKLLDAGYTEEMIDAVASYMKTITTDGYDSALDYASFSKAGFGHPGVPKGRLADSPAPYTIKPPASDGLIVPMDFLIHNREVSVPWFNKYAQLVDRIFDSSLYMMGINTARHHDGTTAAGSHYREAAGYIFFPETDLDVRSALYEYKYGGSASIGSIPPFHEGNHFQHDFRGPLRSNWTEPCPRLSGHFTYEDREEACVPILESIYGTKGLVRLEKIKAKVDPDYLFNGYGMVGYRAEASIESKERSRRWKPSLRRSKYEGVSVK